QVRLVFGYHFGFSSFYGRRIRNRSCVVRPGLAPGGEHQREALTSWISTTFDSNTNLCAMKSTALFATFCAGAVISSGRRCTHLKRNLRAIAGCPMESPLRQVPTH